MKIIVTGFDPFGGEKINPSIECEGERQKYSKYNNVFRVFRFLSPTKLNRDEQAGYSEAHSIQPLCLRGVGKNPVLRV